MNTGVYALTRSSKWRVTLVACIVSQVCSWNVRESRGMISLSCSLRLLGARSQQIEKTNLCIWTCNWIRTEKCWTDSKTNKICETKLVFRRASADQQKEQRGYAENCKCKLTASSADIAIGKLSGLTTNKPIRQNKLSCFTGPHANLEEAKMHSKASWLFLRVGPLPGSCDRRSQTQ